MIDREPPTEEPRESSAAPAATAGPSAEDVRELLDELDVSGGGNLIGILQEVQERFGYLPAAALEEIARRSRTPLSRIYGVVSFYSQFYTTPRGRHTIRCCRGTACHVRGGKTVLQAIQELLGIEDGETTEDMKFYLETVACLGTCFLAPVMMIDNEYFGDLTPQRVQSILESFPADES